MNTIFALLPIVLLIFLMTKKKAVASHIALPITALTALVISFIVFQRDISLSFAAVIDGFLTAFTPILIIWGAIFLFQSLETGGGMTTLRRWLNSVSKNEVAQLMIVGWAFPFLIEGASGFGTPAALAAPILVGLGFKPIRVAIMALIMNSVPVSFGAVGTPTWFGFSGIENLSAQMINEIGIKSALLHGAAALFVPIAALAFVISWKTIRHNLVFIYLSIAATIIPYIAVASINYEFPALIGGMSGLIFSVLFAKFGWGLEKTEISSESVSLKELVSASFPLWSAVLVLIITRIPQLGIKALIISSTPSLDLTLGSFGVFSISPALVVSLRNILSTTESWSLQLLYVPSIIPFILVSVIYFVFYLKKKEKLAQVWNISLERMRYPAIALFAALIFVNLMMVGGEDSAVAMIGTSLAALTGTSWQFFSPFLGALGSFFSGSNTVSNLTFGGIQDSIAQALNLNRSTILALQSVGGALGNMVCINNIVAVSTVLALSNQEGFILKRTVFVALPYAALTAGLSFFL
jgi:lactate permease